MRTVIKGIDGFPLLKEAVGKPMSAASGAFNRKKGEILLPAYVLLLASMFIFYTGCALSWSPTDDEAVRLVKRYYSFSREGTEVEASIVARGEFMKECKCYPIKFKVSLPTNRSYEETYYFFKNESGEVDIRKYKLGIKT